MHFNLDDSFEFFGGTVDARYLLSTFSGDDNFDWTQGWNGRGQFWVALQKGDDGDKGIEADNNTNNRDLEPRSNPTIYNVTLIGAPTTTDGSNSDRGVMLREGTAAKLYNVIVTGFKNVGVEIDHSATFAQAQNGNLIFNNSLFFGNGAVGNRGNFSKDASETPAPPFTTENHLTVRMDRNREADPLLRSPYSLLSPDFRPALESPARNLHYVRTTPDDGFFTRVDFIGGVDPLSDWTQMGWTTFSPN